MFRIGQGYDVHRLEKGRELWLGGVLIPHSSGLSGHSDADVLLLQRHRTVRVVEEEEPPVAPHAQQRGDVLGLVGRSRARVRAEHADERFPRGLGVLGGAGDFGCGTGLD